MSTSMIIIIIMACLWLVGGMILVIDKLIFKITEPKVVYLIPRDEEESQKGDSQ